MFIIFINDLVKSFGISGSDPIVVNGLSINSLLYTDSFILLFDSEEYLQKSLDCLNEFCTNGKLDVNHEISKVIVFNLKGMSYMNILRFKIILWKLLNLFVI